LSEDEKNLLTSCKFPLTNFKISLTTVKIQSQIKEPVSYIAKTIEEDSFI